MKNKSLLLILSSVIIFCGLITFVYAQSVKVEVLTDKSVYSVGEAVKVNLAYEGKIYKWGNDAWSIQKWENGSWVVIQDAQPTPCDHIQNCKDIDFSAVKECPIVLCEAPSWYKVVDDSKLEWDQTYKKEEKSFKCEFQKQVQDMNCGIFAQVSAGKYKIRFEYTQAYKDFLERKDVKIEYAEKEIEIK